MAPLYQAAHGPKPLSNYPQSQNSMQPTFSEPQMEANAGLEMGHQSGQFNRNDGSVIILPYQNQNPIINSQTMQSSRYYFIFFTNNYVVDSILFIVILN